MQTRSAALVETPQNRTFLQMCRKIDAFIQSQVYREEHGLPLPESLERKPDGGFFIRKPLVAGLTLTASPSSSNKKTTILRTFFDPARFKAWENSLGPVSMIYLNPYDLEITKDKKSGEWGFYLDGQKLPLNLEAKQVYLLAKVEITGEGEQREIRRVEQELHAQL